MSDNKNIEESIASLSESMLEQYKSGENLKVFSTSNFVNPASVYALLKTIETIAENNDITNDYLPALLHSTIDLIDNLKDKPENYLDNDNVEDSILASLLEKTGLAYPENSKLTEPSLFEKAFKEEEDLKNISKRLLDNALNFKEKTTAEEDLNDNRKLNADALLNVAQVICTEYPDKDDKLTSYYVDIKKQEDEDFEYKVYGALFCLYEDVKEKDNVIKLGLTNDQVKRLEEYVNEIIDNPNLDSKKLEEYKDEYSTVDFISFHYTEDVLKKLLKEERELNNGVWSKDSYNNSVDSEESLKEEEENLSKYYIDSNKRYLEFLEKNNLFILNSTQKIRNKIPGLPIKLIPGAPMGLGFGAIGSNLLGVSLVNEDNVCLFNVSPLTGTIKFTTPGESSNISYVAAALNIRKNGWETVHLNYNGNEQAAISFFQNSIESLVKYGGYSYDDIKLPRRFKPILEAMKMQGGEFSPVPQEEIVNDLDNVINPENTNKGKTPEKPINVSLDDFEEEIKEEVKDKNDKKEVKDKNDKKEEANQENLTKEERDILERFNETPENISIEDDLFIKELNAEEPPSLNSDIEIPQEEQYEEMVGYDPEIEAFLNEVERNASQEQTKNQDKGNKAKPK